MARQFTFQGESRIKKQTGKKRKVLETLTQKASGFSLLLVREGSSLVGHIFMLTDTAHTKIRATGTQKQLHHLFKYFAALPVSKEA